MIDMNKLKYKATDIAIVVGVVGVIGIIGYFVASTVNTLKNIDLGLLDDKDY